MSRSRSTSGFTLIELSIVLVIIGLIVGGVLVGRDLIKAATARSQISQMDSVMAAVNNFRGKYNYLPGDITDPDASNFGFAARGGAGAGDGNGSIQAFAVGQLVGYYTGMGENALFWRDLSQVGLIQGNFNSATATSTPTVGSTGVDLYYPRGKIGTTSMLIYSTSGAANYLTLANVTGITNGQQSIGSRPLSVAEAEAIDSKIDDDLPGSGTVIAALNASDGFGAYSFFWPDLNSGYNISIAAQTASDSTCYDNGGAAGVTPRYSIGWNKGASRSCGFMMRMK